MFPTDNISPNHAKALQKKFGPKWPDLLGRVLAATKVFQAYDVVKQGIYIGSMVIGAFSCRLAGKTETAVAIESIVAGKKGAGAGTLMIRMCAHIVRAFSASDDGYIFAQCLPLDFWLTSDFEITRVAQCFVYQTVHILPEYEYEDDCQPRVMRVTNQTQPASPGA